MVDRCAKSNHVDKKRSRRKAGERLPALGLKPLDPGKRLVKPRPRRNSDALTPNIESDLYANLPVTNAELDAILQLLGDDLKAILG